MTDFGRSPEHGPFLSQGDYQSRGYHQESGISPTPKPPGGRSPSLGWQARREEEPQRRGVHFLSQQQVNDNSHQGNGR